MNKKWEKQFDKEKLLIKENDELVVDFDKLKSFISKLLEEQKEEIVKAIEKKKIVFRRGQTINQYKTAYNQALSDITKIIKEL